jgi:hypothetical protein
MEQFWGLPYRTCILVEITARHVELQRIAATIELPSVYSMIVTVDRQGLMSRSISAPPAVDLTKLSMRQVGPVDDAPPCC